MTQEDIQESLLRFLQGITPPGTPALTPSTPLFATGLFDSVALVELVLWVEQTMGTSLDPSSFDLQQQWATVADVAAFVERHRTR